MMLILLRNWIIIIVCEEIERTMITIIRMLKGTKREAVFCIVNLLDDDDIARWAPFGGDTSTPPVRWP